jgi:hypothetical protein
VTMIGAERPDTKVEVILSVDTHTSTSTWRWLWTISRQTPGRVERANDRKGLREAPLLGGGLWPREVRWDRRYQQLRGLKLARHLKAQGIEVLEVERPKRRERRARAVRTASPTPPTPRAQHERCWLARRQACPRRVVTAVWR